MDLKQLQEPLKISDIDFRVQSVNKGGYATILAYKDARVDMNRLDSVCGPLNWKREHTRDNANCIISIWDEDKKQWVSKEDTGTESYTEKEKGLASDSFKRAGFNWGIGRELYDYPIIQIKLNSDEFENKDGRNSTTWKFKLREWKWKSEWKEGKLVHLSCVDEKGAARYSMTEEVKPEKSYPDEVSDWIKTAKTIVDLEEIWNNNKELQTNKEFINAVTNRKKELK